MKYGLAWVDPVTNRFVRWSTRGFDTSEADWAAMRRCIDDYNARQHPENPENLLLVVLPVGDDGEPIENETN